MWEYGAHQDQEYVQPPHSASPIVCHLPPGRDDIARNPLTPLPSPTTDKDTWINTERLRWARHFSIPITTPLPPDFPAPSLPIMRVLCALVAQESADPQQPRLIKALDAFFSRHWEHAQATHKPELLRSTLEELFGAAEAEKRACPSHFPFSHVSSQTNDCVTQQQQSSPRPPQPASKRSSPTPTRPSTRARSACRGWCAPTPRARRRGSLALTTSGRSPSSSGWARAPGRGGGLCCRLHVYIHTNKPRVSYQGAYHDAEMPCQGQTERGVSGPRVCGMGKHGMRQLHHAGIAPGFRRRSNVLISARDASREGRQAGVGRKSSHSESFTVRQCKAS